MATTSRASSLILISGTIYLIFLSPVSSFHIPSPVTRHGGVSSHSRRQLRSFKSPLRHDGMLFVENSSSNGDQGANVKVQMRPKRKYGCILIAERRIRWAMTRLIRLLWKGMTLPFPMLSEFGKMAQDETTSDHVGFSLRDSFLAIFGYLLAGILAYSFVFERWSILDALYFTSATFTTVGYGDLTCSTAAGRAFTCLFGLGGVATLGIAIATLGSSLITAEMEAAEMAEKASRKRVMGLFEGMPSVLKNARGKKKILDASVEEKTPVEVPKMKWRRTFRETALKFVPAFTFLTLGGALMGRFEGWSIGASLYYAVITAGTIGYGDFCPATKWGRMWAVPFIPLSVAAAGEVLGNVAAALLERRQRAVYKFLMGREVTIDHLLKMDRDHNGNVTREEYVEFMLLEMGLVTTQQLDELEAQFDRLDVEKNGYLDVGDLKLMAELRGAKVIAKGKKPEVR